MFFEDEQDRDIIAAAISDYERLKAGHYENWSKTVDVTDPFNAALLEQYDPEYREGLRQSSATICSAILRCAKRYNYRFVAFWRDDLIGFEDVLYPIDLEKNWQGWPAIWHIARVLDIAWGAGNSHQYQVKLDALLQDHWGTYDLRGDFPIKIGNCPPYFMLKNLFACCPDDMRVDDYLRSCGIEPIERVSNASFGASKYDF